MVLNTMETVEIIFRENADEQSKRLRTETPRKGQHLDKELKNPKKLKRMT